MFRRVLNIRSVKVPLTSSKRFLVFVPRLAQATNLSKTSSLVTESRLAFNGLSKPLVNGIYPTVQRQWFSTADDVVVVVPKMGDSVVEGTLASWAKNVGEAVAEDEPLCSIETDKVNVDIRAPVGGVLLEQKHKAGETVAVGEPLFVIRPGAGAKAAPKAEEPKAASAPPTTPPPAASAPPTSAPAPAPAPAAAAPKPAAPKPAAPAPAKPAASAPAPETAVVTGLRTERRVPMNRMRQRIAQRLKESQNTAAMLTTFNEIDMSKLMAIRTQYKDAFEKKHGVKLGFMSAFVRAAVIALETVPAVNAVIDGTDIVYRDYADISVAVASPRGLVVPVVRNADSMSFAQIEKTIAQLGDRARKDEITIEEMTGGTFTISNGGIYGSLYGTPIINPPQSAILGMHAIKERPVTVDGQVVSRPMMYVALTYDHRLIDGREAVTFLKTICNAVEDPTRILLDV